MRVLAACSLGGVGHYGPLRPLLDAARSRGDETLVIAPRSLASLVKATGHRFVAGGEPDDAEIAELREQLAIVDADTATALGNRDLFGRRATSAILPSMRQVIRTWRPDLILRDPCEYSSAVVSAETATPVAQVAISLAAAEWRSTAAAEPALEEHRPGLTAAVRSTPYLTRFPASLDPSPFPTTTRMQQISGQTRLLPDWWPGDQRPLVYATFGTVAGQLSTGVENLGVLLDAVAKLEARVLLTTGPTIEPEQVRTDASAVVVRQWVDQADVMASASVVVCHGGSGTTLGALAAGVPLVVVPQFVDQYANAVVVERAGAGLVVDRGGRRGPLSPPDAEPIRQAAATLLADSRYRVEAERIAEEFSAAPSAIEALDTLS